MYCLPAVSTQGDRQAFLCGRANNRCVPRAGTHAHQLLREKKAMGRQTGWEVPHALLVQKVRGLDRRPQPRGCGAGWNECECRIGAQVWGSGK